MDVTTHKATTILSPDAPSYPAALHALASPGRDPPTLYLRGELPRLSGVAIVGRREASADALAFTRKLVLDLARSQFAVWSGGAFGVDAAAHEAALEASAPTVVVLGGGLDRPYPKEHIPLFDRVLASGGALVSRLPNDTEPRPVHFLARNRLLAAMTVATVVIEAGLQSGARSTAAHARDLGRPLCVVPHAPWTDAGAGCAEELASGARPVTCVADVIAAIKNESPSKRRHPAKPPPTQRVLPLEPAPSRALDPAALAVLGVLGHNPQHVDVICAAVGQPLPVVVGALLTLTLQAVVVEGPAGSYRRG